MRSKEVALVSLDESGARKLIKIEWLIDLAIGLIALAVYLITLAPGVTWRNDGADSGDLISAAFTLGIPHPTGYPLFTILAAIFSHLPFGDPAKNVNALSALAGAGAMTLTSQAGRALVKDSTALARWISPVVALALAFAPAVWSQATIAEVNTLALFFSAALLAVSLSDAPHRFFWTAAIFGLGLTHHLTIVLLFPSVIILLHPTHYASSQLKGAALVLLAPLALYLYLPIRASAHPPINWGNPETLGGFAWVVTGAPYRPYLLALASGEILSRLALIARFLFDQFTLVGVGLGLWGAAQMALSKQAAGPKFRALALAFGLILVYALIYGSRDSFVYLLPAFMIFAWWLIYGLTDIARRLGAWQRIGSTAVAAVLVLFPLFNLSANFGKMNISADDSARDYARNIFFQVPGDAVILADGDEHFFALEYYRYVVAPDQSQVVVVSAELLQYSWYFDNIRRILPGVDAAAGDQLERVNAVIDASLAQGRAVNTTVQNEWFLSYMLERRDGFYRVVGKRP